MSTLRARVTVKVDGETLVGFPIERVLTGTRAARIDRDFPAWPTTNPSPSGLVGGDTDLEPRKVLALVLTGSSTDLRFKAVASNGRLLMRDGGCILIVNASQTDGQLQYWAATALHVAGLDGA